MVKKKNVVKVSKKPVKSKKKVVKNISKSKIKKSKVVKKPIKSKKKVVHKKKLIKKVRKKIEQKVTNKMIDAAVAEVAGEDVVSIVKILRNKQNVSEFKLAEGIKREINVTRNMLYRLYNNNLVFFNRKKDKKKGWYIYYWTFNQKAVTDLVNVLRIRHLEKCEERLDREKNGQFYVCPNSCMRLDFEQSHDFNFRCPECGTLLDIEDNSKKIKELIEDIARLKKEIKDLKV